MQINTFARSTKAANLTRKSRLAEAEAIRQKGIAEAEALEKKADAMAKYGRAAILEMVVNKLPDMAEAIAKVVNVKSDQILSHLSQLTRLQSLTAVLMEQALA